MELIPFRALGVERQLTGLDLPDDLLKFYSHYEGVGLESSPDNSVRICKLDEVRQVSQ